MKREDFQPDQAMLPVVSGGGRWWSGNGGAVSGVVVVAVVAGVDAFWGAWPSDRKKVYKYLKYLQKHAKAFFGGFWTPN